MTAVTGHFGHTGSQITASYYLLKFCRDLAGFVPQWISQTGLKL